MNPAAQFTHLSGEIPHAGAVETWKMTRAAGPLEYPRFRYEAMRNPPALTTGGMTGENQPFERASQP